MLAAVLPTAVGPAMTIRGGLPGSAAISAWWSAGWRARMTCCSFQGSNLTGGAQPAGGAEIGGPTGHRRSHPLGASFPVAIVEDRLGRRDRVADRARQCPVLHLLDESRATGDGRSSGHDRDYQG